MSSNKNNSRSSNSNSNDRTTEAAISTINALAGENVHRHLDSSNRTMTRNLSFPSIKPNHNPSDLNRTRSNSSGNSSSLSRNLHLTTTSRTATSSNYNENNNDSTIQRQASTVTTSSQEELASSVGFMAQGLAWFREQSSRRKRQYLQNQAEQQARILKQAQEAAIEAQRLREIELQQEYEKQQLFMQQRSQGLKGNSTFQNIMLNQITTTTGSSSSDDAPVESAILPSVAGICGMRSRSESDDDYEEEINFDNTDLFEQQLQQHQQQEQQQHFSSKSRTGEGYTVQLDIASSNSCATTGESSTQTNNDNTSRQHHNHQQQQQPQYEEDDEIEESFVPKVRITEESNLESHPYILNEMEMQQIAIHVLPRTIAYAKWKRLYSLARDGDSFDACLRLIQKDSKTLLVVRTSKNSIFGGYADSPWEPPSSSHIGIRYYGNAGACLFTCPRYKQFTKGSNSGSSSNNNRPPPAVIYYKWTGMNRYIQLCDVNRRMLALGGGGENGEFGLCVEHDFQHGSTGACETFGNLPLCRDTQFDIVDMEIYGFCIGQF